MAKKQGKVHSIISNLVLVKVEGPVSQNEICFIEERGTCDGRSDKGGGRSCLCAGI